MNRRADQLRYRLVSALAVARTAGSRDLCRALGVSQPTFSRLVASLRDEVVVAGKARATRYAIRRIIAGVQVPIPVFELRPQGQPARRLLNLHPVAPRGFYVEGVGDVPSAFHDDLPWFLNDLRPSGYLGRVLALRHAESGNPPDIRLWSADQVLRFITRHGWDLPGAFIAGDEAYGKFLSWASAPPGTVNSGERGNTYPEIARAVMAFGDAGSSAAGEQPKFLASVRSGTKLTPMLVKFSPPVDGATSQRIADLLIAEHLALKTLRCHGFAAPMSSILAAGGRTFLEVERFDRQEVVHRVGLVSLESLDAAFVGSELRSWTAAVGQLVRLRVVPSSDLDRVRWLELFGRLIGNTDMHFGNLAFFLDGITPAGLAPPYDMLPMHYFPRNTEVPMEPFPLPALGPEWSGVASAALNAAIEFWQQVSGERRVSAGFRKVASSSLARVLELRPLLPMLPRG